MYTVHENVYSNNITWIADFLVNVRFEDLFINIFESFF